MACRDSYGRYTVRAGAVDCGRFIGLGARAPAPKPRALIVLLLLAAVVGVIVSLAAWAFLELISRIQILVFTDLPKDLGYHSGAPLWWYVVVLGLAGLLVAFAIVRLPGEGGHIPAEGLKVGGAPTRPIDLPGVILAALATVGLGLVLGPEAPLIALGAGLGLLAIKALRRDIPDQAQAVIAGVGELRGDRDDLRLADHRGRDPARSARAGPRETAAVPAPGPARSRDWVAGLAWDGIAHRPQQQRLRARRTLTPGVGETHRRRLRLDDPARARGCRCSLSERDNWDCDRTRS